MISKWGKIRVECGAIMSRVAHSGLGEGAGGSCIPPIFCGQGLIFVGQ